MTPRLIEPTIVSVITAGTLDVPSAPEPRSIWSELAGPLEAGVAFVLVSRGAFRYTLAIDQDWLTFSTEVQRAQGHEALDGVGLPRRAIRAVVEGWPEDWASQPDLTCRVSRSADHVPHISLMS